MNPFKLSLYRPFRSQPPRSTSELIIFMRICIFIFKLLPISSFRTVAVMEIMLVLYSLLCVVSCTLRLRQITWRERQREKRSRIMKTMRNMRAIMKRGLWMNIINIEIVSRQLMENESSACD